MKLEQQVCSLGLSRKLKELGLRQESAFYWVLVNQTASLHYGFVPASELKKHWEREVSTEVFAAFTVAELGEMLPKCLPNNVNGLDLHLCSTYNGTIGLEVGYQDEDFQWKYVQMYVQSEADARAKMLVYLLENKLVTAEEVNGRTAA